MPIDPFLEPLLAQLPSAELPAADGFAAWRDQGNAASNALMGQLGEPGPEVSEKRSVKIPVDGGTIELHVYRPTEEGDLPIHLFLHGGGWVAGDIHLDFIDAACRERSAGAACVVVAVNYRKAPEHQFPTPLLDCQAAMLWVVEHAGELGGRADLITIGGQSAGANLAAALCLKLRDEGGPAPVLQLLEVPALDLDLSQPSTSMATYATGYGLERTEIEKLVPLYLPDPATDVHHPYASPLRGHDLTGLPPAYVLSAECDPLCDDGERYVERLRGAGVEATFSLQAGHIHGSAAFTKVMESAQAWRSEMLSVLHNAHQRNS
ncbi:alpha/beta hydrolase [Nocardioides sp. NPDC058538]|uniref:alpha/beta hydrolase n=1 Tax=Nocardioides sp. NPDC058538 TaxID=3346542 RepID=UPI003657D324